MVKVHLPDINVIELVWSELKRFLRKRLSTTKQQVVDRAPLLFGLIRLIRRDNSVLQIIIEKKMVTGVIANLNSKKFYLTIAQFPMSIQKFKAS